MSYGEYIKSRNKKEKITIKQASQLMGKSEAFVRIAMQRRIINIGECLKKDGCKRYDYHINPVLFYKYLDEYKKPSFKTFGL